MLFFVFLADVLDNLHRLHANALGINAPQRRMILDAIVEARLRDGGVVYFAVAVTTIANQVHDDVAAELRAVFGGELAHAHDCVGILPIDVKDGNRLALGDVRSEPRGMLLLGACGESDQIVDDDVDRAAHGVRLKVSKVERLGPNTLPSESGVTVHHDGDDFGGAACAVARLLRANSADGDWINCFQMARVGNQVNADFLAR